MHICIPSGFREERATLKNRKKMCNILYKTYTCANNKKKLRDKLRDAK